MKHSKSLGPRSQSEEDTLLAQFFHRTSLIAFIKAVAPWFTLEEVHHLVAFYFEKVETGEIKRLMLSMPPRGSKSWMSSILLPSWWMGNHPSDQIMAVGYKMDLPKKFSRQVMGIMRSREYGAIFPGVKLAKDAHGAGYWTVAHIETYDRIFRRGEYQAAGITSGIAGSGFNLGIVDDPLSEQDKDSKVAKDRVWDWWGPGFYTRRQPERNAIILINTRWALDDLSGRLIEASRSGGDKWEIINIPAILDGENARKVYTTAKNYSMAEPIELKAGDPFSPRRFTKEELARSRANMAERDWQALYMGNPTEDEGQIIKRQWWRLWPHKELPECEVIFATYDTAFEAHENADYSAMTLWGVFKSDHRDGRSSYNMILLNRWKGRVEAPDLPKVISAFYCGTRALYPLANDADERKRVNLLCGYAGDENVPAFMSHHAHARILIENKGSGIWAIKELRRQRSPRIPVERWTAPRGTQHELGKYSRAQLATLTFEQGSIWYPDRPWAEEVIDECAKCRFDGSDASDDLPDTVVMAATYVRQRYLVERESDINEEEEDEAPVKIKRRRGYGVTG